MRKKIRIYLLSFCAMLLGIYVGIINSNFNFSKKNNYSFGFDNLESTNEEDKLYVETNNELVSAIEAYESGEMSENEYLELCNRISKKLEKKTEYDKISESEKKYKKEN